MSTRGAARPPCPNKTTEEDPDCRHPCSMQTAVKSTSTNTQNGSFKSQAPHGATKSHKRVDQIKILLCLYINSFFPKCESWAKNEESARTERSTWATQTCQPSLRTGNADFSAILANHGNADLSTILANWQCRLFSHPCQPLSYDVLWWAGRITGYSWELYIWWIILSSGKG